MTGKLVLQYCTWLLDGFEETCRHNDSILWKRFGLRQEGTKGRVSLWTRQELFGPTQRLRFNSHIYSSKHCPVHFQKKKQTLVIGS